MSTQIFSSAGHLLDYCEILIMGGWKLEVGKMFLYMAFPVGCFHYFNQPEYFEEWVTNLKTNSYHPRETKEDRERLRNCINDIRKKEELKLLKALDESN